MAKNFDYLQQIPELHSLYVLCDNTECLKEVNRDSCAVEGRKVLEWLVRNIYELKHAPIPERASLYELMTGEPFTGFLGVQDTADKMMMNAHYLRKAGNKGAHAGGISDKEALFCVKDAYNLVGGILLKLQIIDHLNEFDATLIPKGQTMVPTHISEQSSAGYEDLKTVVSEDSLSQTRDISGCVDFSEAETRQLFINLMLEEAGWEVLSEDHLIQAGKACIEVEVEGMPNSSGKGYADYVLFGSDGIPLAVIEAKRTTKDASVGRQQANLYADCLEKKYRCKRPVVYYSNGYKSFIIDGMGYPTREVLGFHTADELSLMIQRRGRSLITDRNVDRDITDRNYQIEAIHSMCDHFNKMNRRGLLVMATGTGKTRVAISLCELLMRNNWISRVLFLADRTSLVDQAHKNFVKLLPHESTTVLNEESNPNMDARIMFSTYQTMIHKIDTEEKQFTIGRFDLIIVDEAHRSIFGKYSAIIDYFDALIVGLTATPRADIDKNTYTLFGTEDGQPNFAYELDQAVADGYLVNYNVQERESKILKEGIKYADLSKEEAEQIDKIIEYERLRDGLEVDNPVRRDIKSSELFTYIYNKDTIDKVLTDLMENGMKVSGGEKIGKTIIFAYNHKHAQMIVDEFAELYPELGPDYCVLIDYSVNYAQSLIDQFEQRQSMPQIAVTVIMLDTGIDVPDILNLVFFKPIYSKIKFWQMIGRGTRLSPGIFDNGEDKKEFYIFDWFNNFRYFSVNPEGKQPIQVMSLTERLFGLRVDIKLCLQSVVHQQIEYDKQLHDELRDLLYGQVLQLQPYNLSVRKKLEIVTKYQQADIWQCLTPVQADELKREIAPLLPKESDDEGAKKFDILALYVMLSMVDDQTDGNRAKAKIETICQALQEKASIPQVMAKMPLINIVAGGTYWEGSTLRTIEELRTELRELVKFLLGVDNKKFIIDIEDVVSKGDFTGGIQSRQTYKQRVIDFLRENRDLPVLQKIYNLEQLTLDDIKELERICWQELGTKEEYEEYVAKGQMVCGDKVAIFIRSQIGVDRQVAMQHFTQFISDNDLNSEMEEYIKTIISYVCENGNITRDDMVNHSPFMDIPVTDVFGVRALKVVEYVNEISRVVGADYTPYHNPINYNFTDKSNLPKAAEKK